MGLIANTMKKICNLIILDASGSMTDKASEVRYGLVRLFEEIQKANELKQRTIVCDFSSAGDFNVLVNTKKPEELTLEVADSYGTRGMTALYDAIGKAFALVGKNYDGVFVNIMTDGQENNSVEFRLKDIQALIGKKRKKGWAITFMGTTEEALKEAGTWGVSQGNMLKYADTKGGAATASLKRSAARQKYFERVMSTPKEKLSTDDLFETHDSADKKVGDDK